MASSENIRDAVQRANDNWDAAFNSGSADEVAACYTADATVLPATHEVIAGNAAIRDFWAGLIGAGVKEHGIQLIDVGGEGDLAYFIGKWWASGPGEGGGSQGFGGSVMAVLRRQPDGSWKRSAHSWN